MTEGYREIRTNVPPILALDDGRLVVKLIAGDLTIIAGVGDGRFFVSQVIEKLVDPALLARWPATPMHHTATGFFNSLTPEQQRAVLSYTGDDTLGDPREYEASTADLTADPLGR